MYDLDKMFNEFDYDDELVMCNRTFCIDMFIKGNWYSYWEYKDNCVIVDEFGEEILWHKSKVKLNFQL